MRLRGVFVLAGQLASAASAFNYQVPDPSATIHAVAVDAEGNTYVTGSTVSSTFPTTPGVLQPHFGGGQCSGVVPIDIVNPQLLCGDAFIVKLDPTGIVVWATYLGGGGQDIANAIAVDPSGDVYVAGVTSPPGVQGTPNNFPTTAGSAFPHSTTFGDGFMVKINPAGSQMIYGTYFPVANSGVLGMAIDSNGNAYATAVVSPAISNFPTTPGAFQNSNPSHTTGLVLKLNAAGSALVYATYLGRTGTEDNTLAEAIAVDSSGNAFLTGLGDADFPVTPGAFQSSSSSGAFVSKLNSTGSALIYSTFLGGAAIREPSSKSMRRAALIFWDKRGPVSRLRPAPSSPK